MFMGDQIERTLRSNDRRAKKKCLTWIVLFTTIEYSKDHTRFSKLRYI